MRFRKIYSLFAESIAGWSRNQASLYAAALAYYTIFSEIAQLIQNILASFTLPSQTSSGLAAFPVLVALIRPRSFSLGPSSPSFTPSCTVRQLRRLTMPRSDQTGPSLPRRAAEI